MPRLSIVSLLSSEQSPADLPPRGRDQTRRVTVKLPGESLQAVVHRGRWARTVPFTRGPAPATALSELPARRRTLSEQNDSSSVDSAPEKAEAWQLETTARPAPNWAAGLWSVPHTVPTRKDEHGRELRDGRGGHGGATSKGGFRRNGPQSGNSLCLSWRQRRWTECCHRFVYVLPEPLLRPPFGVGILLPAFGPEVPDLVTAGLLPAAYAQTHRAQARS